MSARKINEEIQFMDEEKRQLCRMLTDIMRTNTSCLKRIESTLKDLGLDFIEQLSNKCLLLILRMEASILNGTFKDVFIKEEFILNSLDLFNAV